MITSALVPFTSYVRVRQPSHNRPAPLISACGAGQTTQDASESSPLHAAITRAFVDAVMHQELFSRGAIA